MSWFMWVLVALLTFGAWINILDTSKHGTPKGLYRAEVSTLAAVIDILFIFGILINEGVL